MLSSACVVSVKRKRTIAVIAVLLLRVLYLVSEEKKEGLVHATQRDGPLKVCSVRETHCKLYNRTEQEIRDNDIMYTMITLDTKLHPPSI